MTSQTRLRLRHVGTGWLFALALSFAQAAGAVTVTASPTTCATVAGIGTVNWGGPANARTSNNSYATANVDGTTSRYLQCTGYNFAIPTGATITGITVRVERRSSSTANGGSRDAAMRLVKAGLIGATDRATATIYTTADVIEAHGGATDLWGTTWTPAEINAANFGAAFAATKPSATGAAHTIRVDHISITVDYTLTPGTYTMTASPTTCTTVAGIGTVNWGGPGNAISSNNAYAAANVDGTTTRYLRCLGYNFAIPSGATINGITVNVERRSSSTANGGSRDAAMRLVKAGVIGTTDRSTATTYTTADVIEAHGGAADLWGTTWTPAEINAANFGAAFAATKPSSAGATHTIRVDHIPITITFTITGLDHIRIEHSGNGLTCTPSAITVKACVDAACTTLSTSAATVTLSPGGGWSANPVTFTGSTVLTLSVTTPSTVVLGTSAVTPTPSGVSPQCVNSSGGAACSHVFADTGFIISAIPAQSAGVTTGGHTIQAVKKSDSSAACVGVFTGNVAIDMASQCLNPATCAGVQMRINGTPIVNNNAPTYASYTPVTLNFGANSIATFTLGYADVGNMSLGARYALGGGNFMTGTSNTFVVKPFGFTVSSIQTTVGATPNPGAANASGAVFIKAGDAFTATVTAIAQGGSATPNFGKETSPEGVLLQTTLVAPGGGANPALSNGSIAGGSFAAGVATPTNLAWDEVGIFTLTPRVADGDYLGAGDVVGTTTGNVGRFYPHHFVAAGTLTNRAAASCAPASSFSYMSEPMALALTLTAQNAGNTTTTNYDTAGGFAKLPATAAWLSLNTNGSLGVGAVDGTSYLTSRLALSGTPTGSWAAGVGSLNANVALNRGASLDGPYENLLLGVAPQDTDGVTVLAGALDLNADATAGNERKLIGTTKARYGRARLSNAHGSELLALPVPLAMQYYNGSGFITNVDDSCTAFTLATDLTLSNYQGGLATGETTPSFSANPVAAGQASINLTAPGAGNSGSVDLTLNVPAWLEYNWTGAVGDPRARATFGVYKNKNEFIYQRESY